MIQVGYSLTAYVRTEFPGALQLQFKVIERREGRLEAIVVIRLFELVTSVGEEAVRASVAPHIGIQFECPAIGAPPSFLCDRKQHHRYSLSKSKAPNYIPKTSSFVNSRLDRTDSFTRRRALSLVAQYSIDFTRA